jgi:acyl-CoA synthetase (NDP forming)
MSGKTGHAAQSVTSPSAIASLLAPSAVTIVGASPNGQITNHILRNLENTSCAFPGAVNLVNPRYNRIFDRPCVGSVGEVTGKPGLVYLLVPAAACLPTLELLAEAPDGVVLYPEASGSVNGYEAGVAAWGRANGVAVLGPQSTGVVSVRARLLGLAAPVVEEISEGGVAVLSQSGGVLAGIVKYLAQELVGLHSAIAFGTAAMLPFEELGSFLLAQPEVRALAVYADGVSSPDALAALLSSAEEKHKPAVVMIGGATDAGRRAVASHSGAAATPRRVIEGIGLQHNAVIAGSLDELVWSIAALDAISYRQPAGRDVAVFTDSGGGGITTADALGAKNVRLVDPLPATQSLVGAIWGTSWNPFDFGAKSLGEISDQAVVVERIGSDPQFGVCAYASTQGIPIAEQSVQIRQIEQFVDVVHRIGKIPFVASPLPFAPRDEDRSLARRAILGRGSAETAVKLRAIATWTDAAGSATDEPSVAAGGSGAASTPPIPDGDSPITGERARMLLSAIPVGWPSEVWVSSLAELDALGEVSFPVVVKSEANLAHRAVVGGVLPGIRSSRDLSNAAAFLLERFSGPISISEEIAHDEEFFVGALREGSTPMFLFGRGGRLAESAEVHMAPLSRSQAVRLITRHAPGLVPAFTDLLLALQEWVLQRPWAEAVDMNPIVPAGGRLCALDAKVHVRH